MKTIKIFLASSEELKEERLVFADLILQLNQLFKGRSVNLELVKWEYLDASMGEKHKQEEYNEKLLECDMCMVLYWQRFGCYTEMELDTAYDHMKQGQNPKKVYVFFKKEKAEDNVTAELKAFKDIFVEKYGHFPCTFENPDTMRLEFLLQLEHYQNESLSNFLEVKNEKVMVDNKEVVNLNKIPFACQNEDYLKMQDELQQLRTDIEKKRFDLEEKKKALETIKGALANIPESMHPMMLQAPQQAVDEATDDLQVLLNRKNELQKEYEEHQKNLFNTARRITELRGHQISERIQRAIQAFERGDVRTANVILAEAEHDAENNLKDYKRSKAETEQKRQLVLQNIDELTLKASTLIADVSIPIDDRIERVDNIYAKAVEIAKEVKYDEGMYCKLLWKYAYFLQIYGLERKTLDIRLEIVEIETNLNGEHCISVASAYNNLGMIYCDLGNNTKSIENYKKALSIEENLLGKESSKLASSYNNIGVAYHNIAEYGEAMDFYKKALSIYQNIYGDKNYHIALLYNNIGRIYYKNWKYDMSLEYHLKALSILKDVLGDDNTYIALTYSDAGNVYLDLGMYDKALEYQMKAMHIREKWLGYKHFHTACSYNNIGNIYHDLKKYDKALEYLVKAMHIFEENLGKEHQNTANAYNNIGNIYLCLDDVETALSWYTKSADYGNREAQFSLAYMYEHGKGVEANINVAFNWYRKSAEQNYPKAQVKLGYMYATAKGVEKDIKKALDLFIKSAENGNSAAQYNLGKMYKNAIGVNMDYAKAIDWYMLAAKHGLVKAYNELAWTYHLVDKYQEALPWAEKAVEAEPENANSIDTLATVYQGLGRYDEALEQFELCLKLKKENGADKNDIKETMDKIAELEIIISNSLSSQ